MEIPYDHIRGAQDWSWTPALLRRLLVADDIERDEVAGALAQLRDPRAAVSLRALVLDPTAAVAVRETASAALIDEVLDDPGDATLRGWWASSDPVLRGHALRSMGPAQDDIVLAVAADPGHPLHADALTVMGFGFERPAHHRLVIAALAHADPAVRAAAAITLLWYEPWVAEAPLIAALDDPDPRVVASATDALCFYRSQRALRALAGRPVLADTRSYDPEGLARDFVEEARRLSEPARSALLRWLAPVDDLLAVAWAEPEPELELEVDPRPPRATPGENDPSVDVESLLAAIALIDGPRAAVRHQVRAVTPERVVSPADRARLVRAGVDHADAEVRGAIAAWCGHWGLTRPLAALLHDPAPLVRKSAAWAFAFAPPDPDLAPLLSAHLDAADTCGIHATETLRSYAVHAGRDRAIAAATDVAHQHPHESMVLAAVHLLVELEARDRLAGLLPRLAEVPLVTWAVHVALLEAARRFEIAAPAARQLTDVDQLDVQVELARLTATR